MSLNIRKAKSINSVFSKFTKKKQIININRNNSKITHKNFLKKERLLDYLNSFLTPRRPSLIKQNILNIKNKNKKNYETIIQSKNESKSHSNISTINKTKSSSIFNSKHNIFYRNENRVNQINILKYKNNLKNLFFNTNKYENYPDKIGSFSPRNRIKLMKIYHNLKFINFPCVTKESNQNNIYNKERSNNELNLDIKNEHFFIKKEKNKKANKNETKNYKIENVNSFQILNVKKGMDKNNIFNHNEKKELEYNYKDKKINYSYFSENNEENKKLNNYVEDNFQEIIIPGNNNINLYKVPQGEKLDKINEINIINKYIDKNNHVGNFSKYNKLFIMENCLNELFFDYSDGNYSYSNHFKYLNKDQKDNNIIISKKIISKKLEKIKNNNENKDIKNEKIINKNKNNKITNKCQIKHLDISENKENINTENAIKTSEIILSLDNQTFTDKNNISNVKNDSNNKEKKDLIIKQSKSNKLNEVKKINFNLNCLYENKNYVNIQLLSDPRNNNKNLKKTIDSKKNSFRQTKLMKYPRTNLELLLDKIPRHEGENNFINAHSVKKDKNDYKNIRRSKIIEFINKNSAIMPPNDYSSSN